MAYKRGRGKKVYDIKWTHEGQEFVVPVRLYTFRDTYPYNSTNERKFCAELDEADIDITDTDSVKLEKAVIIKLKEWVNVDWKLHFVVEISGGRPCLQAGDGFRVGVEYQYYAVGTHASNGQKVLLNVPEQEKLYDDGKWEGKRYSGYKPTPFDKEKWGRAKSDRHARYFREVANPDTKTLIEATPANKDAMHSFIQAMQRLLDKMHDSFHPDKIERTLQALDTLGLPAPEKKAKANKKAKKKKKTGRAAARACSNRGLTKCRLQLS